MPLVVESTPGYMPESEPVEFQDWDVAWNYAMELGCELADMGYRVVPDKQAFQIVAEREGDLGRHIDVMPDEPEMQRPILCASCGKELRGGPLDHLTDEDRVACPSHPLTDAWERLAP